jgi:RHS repeat-associated protein
MVIKVMAGDKIDIFGRSYHSNGSAVSNSNSTPLSILHIMSGVISSPSNAIGVKGVTASQWESWNSSLLPSSFIRGQNYETGTTIPKAYINYIFLDEQFRYVGGGASRVGNYGEVKQHWSELSNLAAQNNGYLLVYVSNESNFTVFFDNLQVVHKPGPIVEETHYYPFGLVMNGISSKGLNGTADNKLKFNGKEEQRKEFYDGSGLDWLDFGARMYDNQIGRWNIVDPLADHPNQVDKSSYSAFWNNPITYDDPDGKCPLCPWLDAVIDVGFVLYDVGVLVQEKVTTGKTSSVNWAALGADGASILVPMSVGAGQALKVTYKALKTGDKANDVKKVVTKADDVVDAVKTNKTHGNKLDDKPAEGYTLRDKKTGDVKKYGETTRGDDRYGAGNQKRYTKKELKEKDVYYQKETIGTKKEMHKWQHEKIKEHKSNNNGSRPSLNKSDY